jgi:hypothetical protein
MSFGQKKNLILHDYFENFGGGERLVTNLYNTNTYDLVYGFDKWSKSSWVIPRPLS